MRAVVEVPLEPAPRLVSGLDDAGARGAELLLLPLAVADVREQREVADHGVGGVADRRRRDLDVDQASVLAEPLPLDAGVDLPGSDAGHQLAEPLALLVGDVPERAADHLLRRPAEHPLRRRVPERDPVVEVDLEHGHRRGLDRRPQPLLARAEVVLAPLPLGHVDAAHQHVLAAEDVHDRRRRPLDHTDVTLARDPARQAELRVDAVERRRDPDRGVVAVFLVEELAEAAAAHLEVPPAHRLHETTR